MGDRDGANPLPILKDWDEPVATAKQLADEMGYSRQHVDGQLRDLRSQGRVESVRLGQAVGWYVPDTPEQFEQLRPSVPLMRMPKMICRVCTEEYESGREALALYERVGEQWESVDAICAEHADGAAYFEAMEMESYIQGAAEYLDFAVVAGVTTSGEGRTTMLKDTKVVAYRSKSTQLGD